VASQARRTLDNNESAGVPGDWMVFEISGTIDCGIYSRTIDQEVDKGIQGEIKAEFGEIHSRYCME
jgi:hypothetical protein